MKLKKTISLLFSVVIVAGAMCGCNSEGSTQPKGMISIDDPAVLQPNSKIITAELLEKAATNPVVTSEDHPRWTGFNLGYFDDLGDAGTTAKTVELSAEWGFNSARVCFKYDELFSRDMTQADMDAFRILDSMVAAAIENDMHLNLALYSLPGRNVIEAAAENDYISTAELDLFINEEQQVLANKVLSTIAHRYKDVPNFNLSISPLYEPTNTNLSTGLPSPDYTWDDVAVYLGKAIDAIRAESSERLIIYEASNANDPCVTIEESTSTKAVADEKGNVVIMYNFCQMPYVYACMTDTVGKHIDNMNSSMFIPEYPAYYYAVANSVWVNAPIDINGFLPAGTVLDLYLARSFPDTTLDISVDGISVYRENLSEAEYATSEYLGVYYPYATSEKHINITLTEDADKITISCFGDGGFDPSGMLLTYPEKYAVERWYYAQPYDVYMGTEKSEGVKRKQDTSIILAPNYHDKGRYITVHDDLTYTSDYIVEEASVDTISQWSKAISDFDGNCVIRFERADFSGGIWPEMKEYYEDTLRSFEEYGFSWWSNDWWLMTEEYPHTKVVAECPTVKYAGYEYFNLEMLELFQKYQSKD